MLDLYVTDSGSFIGKDGGKIIVNKREDVYSVPFEQVNSIVITNKVQISSQLLCECISHGKSVLWIDGVGRYIGSTAGICFNENIELQRIQFALLEDEINNLMLARDIVYKKVSNQIAVLKSFNRTDHNLEICKIIQEISDIRRHLKTAENHKVLMGYEGLAARLYYSAVKLLLPNEFLFDGRTRKPPKDPVNALLSLGYTIIHNKIYVNLNQLGMNPYIGFLHKIRNGHASLASDLIEEWRPVIVDLLVIKLIRSGKITKEMFSVTDEGCFINKLGKRMFAEELSKRLTDKDNSFSNKIVSQCRNYKTFLLDYGRDKKDVA